MGRPREFNEQAALERAMHTFWRQGYEATSLTDLLEAMDLSRSSFYQTFGSKHALLQRSLNHYRRLRTDDMLAGLESAESGRAFVTQMLAEVAQGVERPGGRRGCLVVNCANEFAQDDPTIARLVADGFGDFRRVFLAGLCRAREEGALDENVDAETLADYLVSCKSGLETMAKSGAARRQIEAVVEVMLAPLW